MAVSGFRGTPLGGFDAAAQGQNPFENDVLDDIQGSFPYIEKPPSNKQRKKSLKKVPRCD